MQEMKDESELPFTKGLGDISNGRSKKKRRLLIILVVVNITIILPSIIKSLAISASISGEINIRVLRDDGGYNDKDEPEEKLNLRLEKQTSF